MLQATPLTTMVLWGATGQARVLEECMSHRGVSVVAIFDNNELTATPFPAVRLYHGWGGFASWRAGVADVSSVGFLVAIGGDRGQDRIEIQERLTREGLFPLVAAHPTSFIAASAAVGVGSQILAHACVCADARIGRATIVNTAASVDHECVLGDGVHVGPGAKLAGCVVVEDYGFIGTGAVVLPRVRIGARAVVGAGAVVLRDVPPDHVVVGNPARVLRATNSRKA